MIVLCFMTYFHVKMIISLATTAPSCDNILFTYQHYFVRSNANCNCIFFA